MKPVIRGGGLHRLAVFTLLLLLVPTASAHADLVTAEPTPNTRVDTAPSEIRATFSEALDSTYTGLSVEDDSGTEYVTDLTIDAGDRRQVTAALAPMPDGRYIVRWQTLSADDGHTRSGVYLLGVDAPLSSGGGASDADSLDVGATERDDGPDPYEAGARALGFLGISLALGTPPILFLMRPRPDDKRDRKEARRLQGHARWVPVGGAAVAALGGILLAWRQAARIDVGPAVLFATTNGEVLLLRIVLLLIAAGAFLFAARRFDQGTQPLPVGIGVVATAAAMLSTSLGGHASAAAEHLAAAVVNDWLHQVTVGLWLGGVTIIALAAWLKIPAEALARGVRRFRPVAVTSVLVIITTGVLASLLHVPEPAALTETGYGIAILVKVALLLPLMLLGAHNRYRSVPALEHPARVPLAMRRLRRVVLVEVILLAVILVAAGVLTSLGPPGPKTDAEPAPAVDDVYHVVETDDVFVRVTIEPIPVEVGFQNIIVDVEPKDPGSVNLSKVSVFATFIPPSDPSGEASPVEGHDIGDGQWHFGGAIFVEPGQWTMKLTVQGDVFVREDIPVQVISGNGADAS